jgi:hypothetical protein
MDRETLLLAAAIGLLVLLSLVVGAIGWNLASR